MTDMVDEARPARPLLAPVALDIEPIVVELLTVDAVVIDWPAIVVVELRSALLFVISARPLLLPPPPPMVGVSSLYHFSTGWLLSIALTGMLT